MAAILGSMSVKGVCHAHSRVIYIGIGASKILTCADAPASGVCLVARCARTVKVACFVCEIVGRVIHSRKCVIHVLFSLSAARRRRFLRHWYFDRWGKTEIRERE